MLAAGTVAAFTAYVPLGDLLGVDVEIDGVAAVAGWARRALHVIGGIERLPPIGTLGHEIGPPDFGGDVPLRGLREIVVTNFGEVTLLPDAAVDESDIFLGEFGDFVGGEIRDDRVGMYARVADHVGHRSLLPVGIDFFVAFFAFLRTDVAGGDCGLLLLGGFLGRRLAEVADDED